MTFHSYLYASFSLKQTLIFKFNPVFKVFSLDFVFHETFLPVNDEKTSDIINSL